MAFTLEHIFEQVPFMRKAKEVEPAKNETKSSLDKELAKDKVAASPDRKKGPENEEKGAGEGPLKAPRITVTPPTPDSKFKTDKKDGETEDKKDGSAKKVEPPKKAEPGKKEELAKNVEAIKKEEPAIKEAGEGQAPHLPPSVLIDMSSKVKIREATWDRLEAEDHVLFPRPCIDRIPRFKGENDAVEKLAQLDIFKNAKLVKVNLDKAHERLRLEIIQSGKELVAGTPGLRDAVFLVMHPPMEPSRFANRKAASRMGIHHLGLALDFQAKQVDLVVLGSVAVDMKGRRIGKGEGFSDLEFALLSKLGTIPSDAVIATLVHDVQVYDEFPDSIFKPYDVPVDVIITPTRVITVEKKLDRPALGWSLLSKRRIDVIPIIKQLLDKEQASGVKIELKEEVSDTETTDRRYPTQRRRFMPRQRQASAPEPRGQLRGRGRRDYSAPPPNRGTRTFRRRPRRQTSNSAPDDSPKSEQVRQNNMKKPSRRGPLRRINKPRYTVDFSVRVNGLSSSVRIRDLKAALVERGVRPSDISWRATKGVALLHFAKRRPIQEPAATLGKNANDVVASLKGLSVKPEDGPRLDLIVEVAQPLPPRAALVGPTSA